MVLIVICVVFFGDFLFLALPTRGPSKGIIFYFFLGFWKANPGRRGPCWPLNDL